MSNLVDLRDGTGRTAGRDTASANLRSAAQLFDQGFLHPRVLGADDDGGMFDRLLRANKIAAQDPATR
jgi:hypothetical protein